MGVGLGIVGGAIIGGIASKGASDTQANAAENGLTAEESIYQNQMALQRPYREAGYQALGQIQQNMPNYNKPFTMQDFKSNVDPGYQFRLQQGQQAIQNSAGARGGVYSQGEQAALNDYSQNTASGEYQNAFNRYQQQISNSYNRLASVAGLGQASVGQSNQMGTSAMGSIGNAMTGIGNAQAAGQVGIANAITGGIGQGINYYQGNQLTNAINGRNNNNLGSMGSYSSGDNMTQLQQPELGQSAGYGSALQGLY